MRHGGDALMGRVEHVEHALAKRAGNDEPVVVEEQAVPFKHAISRPPIGATGHGVVGDAAPER